MKSLKTLFFVSLLLTGLISCEQVTVPPGSGVGEALEEPIAPPDIIISVQEAENLYHRYGEDRTNLIESSVNVDDRGNPIDKNDPSYFQATRSLSIDYDTLKSYLAFIEQQATDANTDITGLRIYFGQYTNGKNDGRATVFFNPLKKFGKDGVNDDVAFAIDNSGDKPTSVFVKDVIKIPGSKGNQANLTMPVQGTIQSLAGNRLPWRPPPPPPNDPDYQ